MQSIIGSEAHKLTKYIIDSMDVECLSLLFDGGEEDIDDLLSQILEESVTVLDRSYESMSAKKKFELENLSDVIEETYRRFIFSYFIDSVLSDSFLMNWHNVEWSLLVQLYKLLSILAARDHSKSFQFSYAYPLWKMYKYQAVPRGIRDIKENKLCKEGMIITNEYKLGRKHLKRIKEEIEMNPILSKKLLPKKGSSGMWGNDGLQCKNGAELTLGSYNSSLRGPHPGYIVVDDFLDKSSLYSSEQRNKFIEVFDSEIMNMILSDGQVINVGTPFHENDLFGKLKKDPRWASFEYPSIFPDGSLLDYTRHTSGDILNKRESQGSIIFSREQLVTPVSSASSIFKEAVLRECYRDFKLVNSRHELTQSFNRIVMGIDLARSGEIGADYLVFTTLGVDDLERRWILNIYREKGLKFSSQKRALRKLYYAFKHDLIICEDNQMQAYLVDEGQDLAMPIEGHTTTTNKYDLEEGVPSLVISFENQKMLIPRGNDHSVELTDIFIDEATAITWGKSGFETTAEHDDTVLSLWKAELAARKATGFLHGFA